MIQLAEILPDKEIVMTLSRQLSWSHFVAVLPLKVDLQRDFYAEMCRYITELPKRELLEQKLHKAVALARKRHPGAKLSLDALCTRYGIDRSHRVKHGALLDAELLAQVYVELTGGRQIGLELAAENARSAAETQKGVARVSGQASGERREPRPHAASSEELARHRAFLEQVDTPIWSS